MAVEMKPSQPFVSSSWRQSRSPVLRCVSKSYRTETCIPWLRCPAIQTSRDASALVRCQGTNSTRTTAPVLTSQEGTPNYVGLAATGLALSTLMLAAPALAEAATAANPAEALAAIPGDSPLTEGFLSGFLLIFFSELGDKTFFIALLLALKQPRLAVFTGTFGALAVMTVISVCLGQALHIADELVPKGATNIPYDDILAAALLIFFGIKTIQNASDADESEAEEKEEAQEAVDALSSGGGRGSPAMTADSSPAGALATSDLGGTLGLVASTFALVFAAEWGDKSFLATIALAAASSPLGVTTGAVAGHGVATGLAVAGGSVLSKYFAPSVLQYAGGGLFLVFAAVTIFDVVTKLT